ncbi:hypothetical protein FGB62_8g113 [Gracilaria domingensis]|nr:hypothetical protein FGB62_8g113 [Gracilaria domingensis]
MLSTPRNLATALLIFGVAIGDFGNEEQKGHLIALATVGDELGILWGTVVNYIHFDGFLFERDALLLKIENIVRLEATVHAAAGGKQDDAVVPCALRGRKGKVVAADVQDVQEITRVGARLRVGQRLDSQQAARGRGDDNVDAVVAGALLFVERVSGDVRARTDDGYEVVLGNVVDETGGGEA